jgi:hypothetical protein
VIRARGPSSSRRAGESSTIGDAPGEMGDTCWGIGGVQGALGYEDLERRGDGPGEMGDDLPFIDLGGP